MFNVGSGCSRIQLPTSIPLAGYLARTESSCGMHDPLFARVAAVESEGRALTVVSLDLLYSDTGLACAIRSAVAKATQADPSSIMICCTHTHSAPACIFPDSGRHDPSIVAAITGAAADAALDAWSSLELCELYHASGTVTGVASRRSELTGEAGPIDQFVYVAEFRSRAQSHAGVARSVARIVSFACHPTVLGPDNLMLTRDLPGFIVDSCEDDMRASGVERPFGMFLNGAAADVSTRYTRRSQTFDEAARLGRQVASRASELAAIALPSSSAKVSLMCNHVQLPRKPSVSWERALESIGQAESEAERLVRSGADHMAVKAAQDRAAAWRIVLTRSKNRAEAEAKSDAAITAAAARGAIRAEICMARLGDLVMALIPGELPYDTGKAMEEAMARARPWGSCGCSRECVWVVGYSNGHFGYLVPERAAPDAYEQVMSDLAPEATAEVVRVAATLSSKGMCIDPC
ncbi:MAG: neutral/alkaline non-lysosomal ceramidase N-terminal domain-containing protein [Clostridia bacterium]|nr:neutral/alkaline non-lysosomal ceramidase N-terminal domain-containing protein [Clostridia bacterium]